MANPDWIPKPIRWFINRIDTPFDNMKHYWHGLEIEWFGQWYKCSAHMSNKPGTIWDIRKIDRPNPYTNNHLRIGWNGIRNKL